MLSHKLAEASPFRAGSITRVPYEEIRDFGGSHTTPVGSTVVTNHGEFSDTTSANTGEIAGLFAVSDDCRARCNFRSSSAADPPRIPRE